MRMIPPSTSSLSAGMISPRNWLPGNLTTSISIGPNDMSHLRSAICSVCALRAAWCRPDCRAGSARRPHLVETHGDSQVAQGATMTPRCLGAVPHSPAEQATSDRRADATAVVGRTWRPG